jgi:hypothetical protein
MRPHNPNKGSKYNGQNGVGMSVDPGSQMMDPSASATTSIDNNHHGPLSNKSLASALASATQENQHRVCKNLLAIC